MPAGRRAERAFLAADSPPRGRDRPCGDGRAVFDQGGDLALGVDHQQPLGELRGGAFAQQAFAHKVERAGSREFIDSGGHARTLP